MKAIEFITFVGPPIDDEATLQRLPVDLQKLFAAANGFIQFNGGLHIRGACREPHWHSLGWAWDSEDAFHRRYPAVQPDDIPIGQDCIGDQFFLRQDVVYRLYAETGEIQELHVSFLGFLATVQEAPNQALGLEPLLRYQDAGKLLEPGELLSVFPPFCMQESPGEIHLSAVPALDRLNFLASFSKQLEDLDDGEEIRFEIDD